MYKYDGKVIFDYVNGNDLEFDIEELENDYYFMMQVIFYTNDKKMYNLCSDKVKTNFKFVNFVIKKFYDDIPFIINVVNYFIKNSDNDALKIELILIILDFLKKKKDVYDDEYYSCMMMLNRVYRTEKTIIDLIKSDEDNKEIFARYGLGFIFVLDKYSGYKRVMDYFASQFIDDILDMDINFERIVHKHFDSFLELENHGINNFCIDFLKKYDISLAEYVSCNLNNLDTLKKRLRLIKRNWDNYNLLYKKNQYSLLSDVVNDYVIYNNSCYFTLGIICYIGKELGILDDIVNYMFFDDESYDVNLMIRETSVIKKQHGLVALKEYLDIKKIILDIISSKDIIETEEKYRKTIFDVKSL